MTVPRKDAVLRKMRLLKKEAGSVAKDAEAPNITATTNPRGSTPSSAPSPMAIGAMITATALLDTISVRIEVSA